MTHPAPSAAPPNALPVWSDGLSLFTELIGPQGTPIVLRYPLTAQGLSSALALIRTRAFDTADRTPTPADLPRTGTLAQQLEAKAILRRIGILP
jgi:hypothetical protein